MKAGTPKSRRQSPLCFAKGGPYENRLVPLSTFPFRVEVDGFRWRGRYDHTGTWRGTSISINKEQPK